LPLVDLDRIPQVALPFINDDHREEARLLNALHEALQALRPGGSPQPVLERFQALLRHTREHFGREEEAMRRASFPPYPVHKEEHERVLEEMEAEGKAFGASGDAVRLGRYVGEAVPAWFVGHIESMDHVTAAFVAMRGG
jgi:hemerythrin